MLEIKNVYKTFNAGTINEKKALNDLNLVLQDGDFVTVIGGNGAGKSTMLNSVAGVYPVDSGTIKIDGIDVTRLPEHKRAKYLGRVFQDPMMGTAADMWIEENMALASRRGQFRGLRWAISSKERQQFREMLALTLLMAVMKKPKLLLLDEHTAALDPKTAATVLALSQKFIDEGHLTAMMVTHNMRDAIKYGNRLIMMNNGRIIIDISGEEKKKLTVEDLLKAFSKSSGTEFANDRALLS